MRKIVEQEYPESPQDRGKPLELQEGYIPKSIAEHMRQQEEEKLRAEKEGRTFCKRSKLYREKTHVHVHHQVHGRGSTHGYVRAQA